MKISEKNVIPNSYSFFNPLRYLPDTGKIWHSVSSIFRSSNPQIQPVVQERQGGMVVYEEITVEDEKETVWVEKERYQDVFPMLNQSTNPYPMVTVNLRDQSKIQVAKTFLTDVERSGQPDQFFIDLLEIQPAPKTPEDKLQLLEKMLEISNGDREKVSRWTQLWNYRLKAHLVNDVMENFKREYNLNPVFARDGFKKVVLSLDTKKEVLTCRVEGKIDHATDADLNVHPCKLSYAANFSYAEQDESVKIQINFNSQ